MYQLEPAFFYTRKDLITWMLMQTGMHGWLLQNHAGWILLDVLFYSMPLLYLLVFIKVKKWAPITALLMLLVNWCYVQCYTLYPSNSIEGHIAQANKFSTIGAQSAFDKGRKSNIAMLIYKPFYKFVRDYIFKLGFLDGYSGFLIARISAHATFLKYAKLIGLQKKSNL